MEREIGGETSGARATGESESAIQQGIFGDAGRSAPQGRQGEKQAEHAAIDRTAPPGGGERASAGGALAEIAHPGAEQGADQYGKEEAEDFHGAR